MNIYKTTLRVDKCLLCSFGNRDIAFSPLSPSVSPEDLQGKREVEESSSVSEMRQSQQLSEEQERLETLCSGVRGVVVISTTQKQLRNSSQTTDLLRITKLPQKPKRAFEHQLTFPSKYRLKNINTTAFKLDAPNRALFTQEDD